MPNVLREGGKMVQGEHCIGMILSKLFVTTCEGELCSQRLCRNRVEIW